MSLMILAQSGGSAGSGAGSFILLGAMFVAMYFLMIRPQQRRARAATELARSVEVGDRIETVAGMFGSIKDTTDDTVDVEIASGVVVTMSRGAVRRKVVE
jgi:preprotein translocase subunit YajC